MNLSQQFASTTSGQIIVPAIGMLLFATMVGIWRGGSKFFGKMSDLTHEVQEIKREVKPEGGPTLKKMVEDVKRQVETNGGSSLKDGVNEIRQEQKDVALKQDALKEKLDQHLIQADRIYDQVLKQLDGKQNRKG